MNLGHGGNVEEVARKYKINQKDIIDFSANINPLGINSKVKAEMIKALDKIERYPDITYYDLKSEIANYEGVKSENIILGNGAAEVIFNITRGLKPKKALIPAPTFSEYEDALNSVGCSIIHYEMKGDFNLDNGFIDKIKEDIDIIFICNPNNPTGVLTSKNYLVDVLKKAEAYNTKVVIDESFIDFISEREKVSVIDLINDYKNLIVVKSLTKFFAFPGIRVGYGVLQSGEYISMINKISVPWSINTVAVYGAMTALKQRDYISESIQNIKMEGEFLFSALNGFKDLKVFKGEVNFIFFKVIKDIDLKEELLKYGLLIRSCNNYKGLEEGYYRVAVRTRNENLSLINALKNILN